MAHRSWSLVLLAGLLAFGQTAYAQTDTFTVNAQYRGMVKKGFTSIGSGTLHYSGTPAQFRITGQAEVNHPKEKGRVYQFWVDMTFRSTGSQIQYVASQNRCNSGSEDALRKIEKILPFVYLVKMGKTDEGGGASFVTPRGSFELHSANTDRNLEVTLVEGGGMAGKFFMAPGGGALEKFRISAGNDVMLSFVTTR